MAYPIDIETIEVQQFRETVWGTPGTATVRRRGIKDFKIKSGNKTERVTDERRGTAVPAYLSRVVQRGGGTISTEQYLIYEDSHYEWESLFGTVTPSGSPPTVTRDYAAPVAGFAALASGYRCYSQMYGDPADYGAVALGAITNKVTLSGNSNSFLMLKTEALLRQSDTGVANMVASASAPELTGGVVAIGADVNLYIAPWGVAINEGTHVVAATSFDFELEIDAQRTLRRYHGNLLPQSVLFKKFTGKLKLNLELNATSAGYLDSLADMTSEWQQQVRLKITDGTNTLRFDFAGASEETPEIFSDDDGALTTEIEMMPKYNPTLGNWLKLQTICGISGAGLL